MKTIYMSTADRCVSAQSDIPKLRSEAKSTIKTLFFSALKPTPGFAGAVACLPTLEVGVETLLGHQKNE